MRTRYLITAGASISILLIGISGYLYLYINAYFNFILFRIGSRNILESPEAPEMITKIGGLFGLFPEQTIALLVSVVLLLLCFLVGIYFYLIHQS